MRQPPIQLPRPILALVVFPVSPIALHGRLQWVQIGQDSGAIRLFVDVIVLVVAASMGQDGSQRWEPVA